MRIIRAAAVTVLAVAAFQLTAPPAHATVDVDITVVYDQSFTSSGVSRTVFVSCPLGQRLLGGGGGVWNGSSRVNIGGMRPDGGSDQFVVGASEIRPGDYTGSWRVYGYAICATNGHLLNLSYVEEESLENSNVNRHARATCPVGKTLLSAGATINGANSHTVLDDIQITGDLRSVDVWGVERETGTVETWSITAYAVCAANNALTGTQLVEVTSASSAGTKNLEESCDDQRLVGLGFALNNAGGHTIPQRIAPVDVDVPDASLSVRPDPTGVPGNWSAKLQLVCID